MCRTACLLSAPFAGTGQRFRDLEQGESPVRCILQSGIYGDVEMRTRDALDEIDRWGFGVGTSVLLLRF